MNAVLEVERLVVGRNEKPVIAGLDLAVASRERVAIVGANGSGKTTLLRVFAGLDLPNAGVVRWSGRPIPPPAMRPAEVGVLFQSEQPTRFSVRELVTLGLALDRPPRDEDLARVDAMLTWAELEPLAERPFAQLSGGEAQRALIARALVKGPRLLLLDEPTNHLDPGQVARLVEWLDRVRANAAVVLATHDLQLATLADRVLLLGAGRSLALGPPGEVLTSENLQRAFSARVAPQISTAGSRVAPQHAGPWREPSGARAVEAALSMRAPEAIEAAPSMGVTAVGLGCSESSGARRSRLEVIDASAAARVPSDASKTTVLIVGHGSRDASANRELEALIEGYRAARPQLDISLAYTELAEPALPVGLHAVASRAKRVVVLPLFLFSAGHVKNDLPLALDAARRAFPGVELVAARALGVHPTLVELTYARVASRLEGAGASCMKTALVVVGRGASDPDANGDFYKLVRLLSEGRDFGWVMPCFIGIARPRVDETLELVARARPERIVIAPYMLFAGRLITKLEGEVSAFASRYPWIKTELAGHLGPDERLFTLFDERIAEAIDGARPLPCDNCQYRVPVSGVTQNVGGMKALLYSVRHGVTHTQAMPHEHAHRRISKHVLVCGNADCADRGSIALLGALRRHVKAAGKADSVRVTKTMCMGRCGEGPTVAVYPDGIWYRGVGEADAEVLVKEHLVGDRLVSRLVDDIMQ